MFVNTFFILGLSFLNSLVIVIRMAPCTEEDVKKAVDAVSCGM